jgi:hypothetical protein
MRVTLSTTEGKSGRAARSIDRPCMEEDLLGGVEARVNGNSKGFVGDRGRDGSWWMWAMREPSGNPGGGSAGGGTSAWSVGGGKVGRGRSMLCVSGVVLPGGLSGVQSFGVGARAHEANKTEGARVVEAGVMSPVEGVWSNPTRRVGPYPSHSKATEESFESGQQSQSIAWARWSGEMSNSSQ